MLQPPLQIPALQNEPPLQDVPFGAVVQASGFVDGSHSWHGLVGFAPSA